MNMLTRIRKWLAPPVFEDEDKTRAARMLNTTLLAVLAIVVMAGIASPLVFTELWQGWAFMSIAALLALGGLLLMRRGHVRLAAGLFSYGVWALHTLLAFISGGMSSFIPASGYMFVIVMASLLLGTRAAFTFVGLTAVAGLGMLYAESIGLLPLPFMALNSVSGWASLTANLIMVPLLLNFAIQSINEALERARRNERALAESNRELQAEIAERVGAEQALRESTEKIRAMFESMTDGITFVDKEGNIVDSNEATVRMHEFESKEELIGRGAFELIAKSDQARALENMQKTLAVGRSGVIEYKLVTKTGREFDGELNAVLLRDEQGNPSAFVALTRDISARKRAEEALQESEEKYSMLFNEMLTGLSLHEIILDDNGKPVDYRFLDVNPAFEKHTGLKKEDLVGRTVLEVLPGTEPIWIETSGEVALGGEPVHFEQYSSEIGKYYEVLTFCPKKGQFATLSSDITERKKIEEELEEHRQHLEKLVEERTRELETVNQELEAFAYSISHDLKAPLRAINSFSAILQEEYSGVLDGGGMDYLNKVRASSLRMSQLIDDLLALSRLGRNELQLMTINLTHITKRIFAEITQDESERNFDFQMMDLPLVEVDVKLIEVLLTNLLTNAVKFTRGRAPAIIEFGFLPEEETPTFYIRDNGVGFDMKYADKLFAPFQRLHTEKEFEGTGIGLAIVQRVVRCHGGRIWVEAELDKGTTFYFTLQT
jgi:PAS domain S-box-containing protein